MGSSEPLPGVSWLSQALGLALLPSLAHVIGISLLCCFLLQLVIGPAVSAALVPQYKQLRPKTRRDWDIRVVAFVHAIFASAAAATLALNDDVWQAINADKVFANRPEVAKIISVSTGYFAWDTLVSLALIRSQGVGFFIHGIACFSVFMLGHTPVFQYFGVAFLFWEVSSIFLNIHWALDKLNLTGSIYQLINGIVLLVTFFGARLIYGNYVSYQFWRESFRSDVQARLPDAVPLAFQAALVALTVLNAYWYKQMIAAIKKRFDGSATKRA